MPPLSSYSPKSVFCLYFCKHQPAVGLRDETFSMCLLESYSTTTINRYCWISFFFCSFKTNAKNEFKAPSKHEASSPFPVGCERVGLMVKKFSSHFLYNLHNLEPLLIAAMTKRQFYRNLIIVPDLKKNFQQTLNKHVKYTIYSHKKIKARKF